MMCSKRPEQVGGRKGLDRTAIAAALMFALTVLPFASSPAHAQGLDEAPLPPEGEQSQSVAGAEASEPQEISSSAKVEGIGPPGRYRPYSHGLTAASTKTSSSPDMPTLRLQFRTPKAIRSIAHRLPWTTQPWCARHIDRARLRGLPRLRHAVLACRA